MPDAGAVEILAAEADAVGDIFAPDRRLDPTIVNHLDRHGTRRKELACRSKARLAALDARQVERQHTMEITALARIEADEPLGCQQGQGGVDRRLWHIQVTREVGATQIALPRERRPDAGQGGIHIGLAQSRKQLTFAREAALVPLGLA
jgi:hypothetical protein